MALLHLLLVHHLPYGREELAKGMSKEREGDRISVSPPLLPRNVVHGHRGGIPHLLEAHPVRAEPVVVVQRVVLPTVPNEVAHRRLDRRPPVLVQVHVRLIVGDEVRPPSALLRRARVAPDQPEEVGLLGHAGPRVAPRQGLVYVSPARAVGRLKERRGAKVDAFGIGQSVAVEHVGGSAVTRARCHRCGGREGGAVVGDCRKPFVCVVVSGKVLQKGHRSGAKRCDGGERESCCEGEEHRAYSWLLLLPPPR
mmetsp:Transcript_656/g.931  ORF Transcript_656/g.931 Transcript_656/m.931 type:complete len:253 (-) Transcript_656:187-945(-)